MITQTILEELRSVPRGRRHIIEISANGAEHDEHALHINLLLTDGHAIDFRDFLVVSMADQPDGIDGLIGQDLLQDLVFVYDGPRGAFRLERG